MVEILILLILPINEKHTDSAENRICKNIDSNFYEGFGIDQ